MPEEGRAEKYGRFVAQWMFQSVFWPAVPEEERPAYMGKLVPELKAYSFTPRKKGSPKNEGCVWELDGIERFTKLDPILMAKLIKEGMHLKYQKGTSERVMRGLMKGLEY